MVGVALGNFAIYAMVDHINRALPEAEQISRFGWWTGKTLHILEKYRELFPTGNLFLYYWAAGRVLVFFRQISMSEYLGLCD